MCVVGERDRSCLLDEVDEAAFQVSDFGLGQAVIGADHECEPIEEALIGARKWILTHLPMSSASPNYARCRPVDRDRARTACRLLSAPLRVDGVGHPPTQEEVGQKLGQPKSFVAKYEGGERRLDVVEFMDVASAVGVDPFKLLRELARSREWSIYFTHGVVPASLQSPRS